MDIGNQAVLPGFVKVYQIEVSERIEFWAKCIHLNFFPLSAMPY
jgi:hypothetical protein